MIYSYIISTTKKRRNDSKNGPNSSAKSPYIVVLWQRPIWKSFCCRRKKDRQQICGEALHLPHCHYAKRNRSRGGNHERAQAPQTSQALWRISWDTWYDVGSRTVSTSCQNFYYVRVITPKRVTNGGSSPRLSAWPTQLPRIETAMASC